MLDEDTKYSIESEFDKAFPYLDKLDEQIKQLKKEIEEKELLESSKEIQSKKFSLFSIFHKKQKNSSFSNKLPKTVLPLRKKTLKHHEYSKDGYIFRIQLIQRYNEVKVHYYEFSVNIKYSELEKKEQFYKKFFDLSEAKQYYGNMEGVFKLLKRRDLIERLFKEKKQEIDTYEAIL